MIYYKKISVFVSPEHMAKMKEIAESKRIKFAELLRQAMSEFIDKEEKSKNQ